MGSRTHPKLLPLIAHFELPPLDRSSAKILADQVFVGVLGLSPRAAPEVSEGPDRAPGRPEVPVVAKSMDKEEAEAMARKMAAESKAEREREEQDEKERKMEEEAKRKMEAEEAEREREEVGRSLRPCTWTHSVLTVYLTRRPCGGLGPETVACSEVDALFYGTHEWYVCSEVDALR